MPRVGLSEIWTVWPYYYLIIPSGPLSCAVAYDKPGLLISAVGVGGQNKARKTKKAPGQLPVCIRSCWQAVCSWCSGVGALCVCRALLFPFLWLGTVDFAQIDCSITFPFFIIIIFFGSLLAGRCRKGLGLA
ncbi:hypothetical protein BDZ91DRAFT_289196 [Kalaharituber pfeilii]|nr:hypothetical protein BDZ91DRAFT_289196 [Kalaharituber pfeilii]